MLYSENLILVTASQDDDPGTRLAAGGHQLQFNGNADCDGVGKRHCHSCFQSFGRSAIARVQTWSQALCYHLQPSLQRRLALSGCLLQHGNGPRFQARIPQRHVRSFPSLIFIWSLLKYYQDIKWLRFSPVFVNEIWCIRKLFCYSLLASKMLSSLNLKSLVKENAFFPVRFLDRRWLMRPNSQRPGSSSEEPQGWMGYLSKAVSVSASYLPTQVADVFSQGRAFATVHLPFQGIRNVCALATSV